ncbi:uncharacterized protein DMAD_12058 [Drosophila madeirensis]|uniref:Uncharacterized protein n=1 Tax=Drosophila madeirensis TaxID=30013 RepID=A0AAU9FFI2_DROMD
MNAASTPRCGEQTRSKSAKQETGALEQLGVLGKCQPRRCQQKVKPGLSRCQFGVWPLRRQDDEEEEEEEAHCMQDSCTSAAAHHPSS